MSSHTPQPIHFAGVADIYDTYVNTDFDIPFWLSECKAAKGKVLELTCGTGRISIPLLKAGVELYCVDYSPEMLAQFRRKLEENRLSCSPICQDMAELRLPERFDLIIVPFHSFSELVDKQKRRAALEHVRDHLTNEGSFICTLQNLPVRTRLMDGKLRLVGEFPMPNDEKLIVRSRLSFNPSSQLAGGEQLYDRYGSDGRLIDHRTLEVNFYLFQRHEFESLAREVGFEVTALYGDYDHAPFEELSSPFMIWKLRKRVADA